MLIKENKGPPTYLAGMKIVNLLLNNSPRIFTGPYSEQLYTIYHTLFWLVVLWKIPTCLLDCLRMERLEHQLPGIQLRSGMHLGSQKQCSAEEYDKQLQTCIESSAIEINQTKAPRYDNRFSSPIAFCLASHPEIEWSVRGAWSDVYIVDVEVILPFSKRMDDKTSSSHVHFKLKPRLWDAEWKQESDFCCVVLREYEFGIGIKTCHFGFKVKVSDWQDPEQMLPASLILDGKFCKTNLCFAEDLALCRQALKFSRYSKSENPICNILYKDGGIFSQRRMPSTIQNRIQGTKAGEVTQTTKSTSNSSHFAAESGFVSVRSDKSLTKSGTAATSNDEVKRFPVQYESDWGERTNEIKMRKCRHIDWMDATERSRASFILDSVLSGEELVLEPNMFPGCRSGSHWTLWSKNKFVSNAQIEDFMNKWLSTNMPNAKFWVCDGNLANRRSIDIFHVHIYIIT